jgi:hypothetical protein
LTANGLVIPAFDLIIKKIRLQGGSKIDGIYCSYGIQNVVNAVVSGQARYFIQPDSSKNVLTAGDNVTVYMSTLGSIPIVGDFFCFSKRIAAYSSDAVRITWLYRGKPYGSRTIPTEADSLNNEFSPLETTRRVS